MLRVFRLQDLVKRARNKQLSPNEYSTGNFTISNMGMYGADAFDAILPPGVSSIAILVAWSASIFSSYW